ncbi:Liprin-alpha-2 [Halotydeus destructor]|nr:Liprin-alpha-2 [Halotydeus destructor]
MWNMMCDVMPTISEDSISQRSGQFTGDEANFEQLMVNMLDERDKLMETLRETQDQLNDTRSRMIDVEKERDSLQRQLNANLPQDFSSLTRELNQTREALLERDEEIQELKAERNNTRLLLEHLECLVSRHERSLRMTVVKRQAQSPAGVSSEVEVLKALKSLFEHHKALDEKVREKLRISVDRVSQLEDELAKEKEEHNKVKAEKKTNSDLLSNGHVSLGEVKCIGTSFEDPELGEMKQVIEKQSSDLLLSRAKLTESNVKVSDLEDQLKIAVKMEAQAKEDSLKLRENLRDSHSRIDDQDARISALERRYHNSQKESSSLHDLNDKLEHELANKESQVKLQEERINGLKEKLELAEQRISQMEFVKKQEQLIREATEDAERQGADQEKQLSFEERISRLDQHLEEKSAELLRSRQREKMNEDHNHRLSATVDKLLAESNERLQMHLKERMCSLEEKNTLMQDLERTRKSLEETQHEKEKTLVELSKLRNEMEALRSDVQSFQTENIQAAVKALSKTQKKNVFPEPEWERVEPKALQNSNSIDVSDTECSQVDDNDNDSILDAMDSVLLSPTGHADAHTLAMMLQEQLDAINNEIRLIQEEKETTEQRAEELESQVGSMDSSMSLLSRGRLYEPQHIVGMSPPQSGRSTPNSVHISPSQDYLSQLYSGGITNVNMTASSHGVYSQYASRDSSSLQNMIRDDQGPRSGHRMRMHSDQEMLPGTSSGGIPYGANVPPDVLPRSLPPNTSVDDFEQIQGACSTTSSMDSLDRRLAGNGQQSHLHYPVYVSQSPQLQKKKRSSIVGRLFRSGSKREKLNQNQPLYSGNYNVDSSDYISLADAQNMAMPQNIVPATVVAPLSSPALGGQKGDFDRRTKKKHELLAEAMKAGTPFALWNGPTIVAWLELWVGMPPWYVAACRANVKSGAIMSALSDAEIQREIGISNPLHRLKLRLAIQEMVALTSPNSAKPTLTSLAFGEMNHEWIGNEWLPSLGLSQYRSTFMECLVDARMLDHLTKKDLRVALKMLDAFHRTSLQYGINCLKRVNYNRHLLDERRRNSENDTTDVLVWTNDRVIKWLNMIGLKEYSSNLVESGVHGALVALDDTFDANQMALALQVPTQNVQARQILEDEYNDLLTKGTERRPNENNHGAGQVPGAHLDRLV